MSSRNYYIEEDVRLNEETSIPGKIEKVFYSSGSWASIACLNESADKHFRASGNVFNAQENDEYTFFGCWTVHEKYGLQFQIKSSRANTTVTKEKIISFLSSGFIKGVGLVVAHRIFDKFGLQTYEIIEKDHKRLVEVSGISERIADNIHMFYMENQALRELREFLPPEITDHKVVILYNKYKQKSIEVLKSNPYQIIKDLDGVGFITADNVATAMGVKRDDPRRVNAGIIYCLQQATDNGHCFSYADNLQNNLLQLLGEVPVSIIADEIKRLSDNEEIIVDDDGAIYYTPIYYAEVGTANIVNKMLSSTPSKKVSQDAINCSIYSIEGKTGYTLEENQKRAADVAFNNCLSIITGGPGTGKTTIIQLILEAWFQENDEESVAMAAPTGKAARRMSEVTGFNATTIHQMLGYSGANQSFSYNKHHQLPYSLIIIDEASMLDIQIAYALLQAVRKGCRIVLIGDIDQLPPIGPGNFFRDMVTSYRVPSVKLKLTFRQAGKIAVNAQKINCGEGPHAYIYDETFAFEKARKEDMQDKVVEKYLGMVRKYGVENCCVLTPMRKKSSTGANILNERIRDALNPSSKRNAIKTNRKDEFRVGDRVIRTKNDWVNNVANGEMGFITSCINEVVTVKYDSGVIVEYKQSDFGTNMLLGYAITIHKSQGSEYKGAVIAFNSEHWFMAQRNLIYTAVTRAKQEVVIVGDAKTITRAVENVQPIIRNTKLKDRLK